MGMIARVLSFVRATRKNGAAASDVKVDTGGGANATAEHYGAPGDDGVPLPGDYAVTVSTVRGGGLAVVAYLDPKTAGVAGPGERRLYARNAAGAVSVSLFLQASGAATLSNGGGSLTLGADGKVTINGVTIDPDGTITTPTDVKAGPLAVSLLLHKHISALPGSPTGPAIP